MTIISFLATHASSDVN